MGCGGWSPPNKNNKNKSYFSRNKKSGCGGRSPRIIFFTHVILTNFLITESNSSLNFFMSLHVLVKLSEERETEGFPQLGKPILT